MTGRRAAVVREQSTAFRIGWLSLVIITVGVHAYTLSSWSWVQDDLMLTSEAPRYDFLPYLAYTNGGHFAPGILGTAWVLTALDPLDYAWANASICALSAGVVVAWGLALREIFGERLRLLIPLVLLALAPGSLVISLFWVSGMCTYPMQIAMGLSVWFLARLLIRGDSTRDLVGLAASYAVGLFFWQKALLIVIPLVFLCLLLGPADRRESLRTAVRHLWPVAVLTLVYLPIYAWAVHDAPPVTLDDGVERSLGDAALFAAHGALDVALPWMVGGPTAAPDSAVGFVPESSGTLALALFGASVVLLIVGVRYRRRGWLAVAMVVSYALVAWGLIFVSARYAIVGDLIVRSPHYTADLVPVMLLAALFLVSRTVLDKEPPLRRPVPAETLVALRRGLVGYLVLVCVAVTVTTGRVWDDLEPTSSKPYLDALVNQARDLGRADVYDTRLPPELVNPVFLDTASRVSDVLGPLELPLTYNQPSEQLLVVDEQGSFRRAAVVGGYVNDGPGPDGECGYAVDQGEVTEIPLTGDLFELDWVMEMTYFTGTDARLLVRTDEDEVELDVPANDPGGLGRRQLPLSGPVTSLSVEGLTGDSSVCVTDVRIGIIEPTDDPPEQLG